MELTNPNITKARVIAFYLPQFHPIKENDEWWGKGFTEWTNVGKAKPLFKGHYQPHVPADLGYYDLRLPEVREEQASMAREAGIEGFCYWHYWFGKGKRLLERPFQEVLESGKPDFPFCLGWANETWSGIWHGNPKTILIEQKYLGKEDYLDHFNSIKKALFDKRYIHVNGKPLFFIYKPHYIPDVKTFIKYWNELAVDAGLKGIYFVGQSIDIENDYNEILNYGFDAVALSRLPNAAKTINTYSKKLLRLLTRHPRIFNHKRINKFMHGKEDFLDTGIPMILPNWDNSPRSGMNAHILTNSTPKLFDTHIKKIFDSIKNKPEQNRIVFLKSWNEWAEGNYVEPDLIYGNQYLKVLKNNLLE